MAKKEKKVEKVEDDFFEDLAKQTGGGLLRDVGKVAYFIDTGNLSLNYICSGKFITGGLPGGKITEVFGPPSSSKSLLGSCLLGSCQRMNGIAILLDCERASNADFTEQAGHVDTSRLVVHEPISIEQCESKIIAITKAIRAKKKDVPILFVWDSIGVTPTEREWKEIDLPETYSKEEFKKIVGSQERPGERARAAGDMLRKINPFLNDNNTSLFIINQIRSNIGVLYGDPDVTAGGGKALEFYASCRLRTGLRKKIFDTKKKPIGVNLIFTNKKNRAFNPGLSVEGVKLFYQNGINPLSGLLSTFLMAGRIEEATGKNMYKVSAAYLPGDDEVTFKSTKEKNDVPLEVLQKCPTLIDATSQAEVDAYMSIYKDAIVDQDEVEVDVTEELTS